MYNLEEKFEESVFKNIDMENLKKIIKFLESKKCKFIEEFITDYLDLLTINYDEFIKKYDVLNKKYNGYFLENANNDMNVLEEFYYV